jgi:integrase
LLPDNGVYCVPNYDYHMNNLEVQELLSHVRDFWARKFFVLASIIWSRGLRVSEGLFINFRDFPLRDQGIFTELMYREAKTNKVKTVSLPVPVAEEVREYIVSNPMILSHYEGFLFFRRNGRRFKGAPVMSTETAGAFMSKWRNSIGRVNPKFLEKYPHKNYYCKFCGGKWNERERHEEGVRDVCPKCKKDLKCVTTHRYRIGWHSLRRNFEDNGLEYSGDNVYFVKEMMGYSDIRVVDHYASKKRLRAKIPEFMQEHITPLFNKFSKFDKEQTSLNQHIQT